MIGDKRGTRRSLVWGPRGALAVLLVALLLHGCFTPAAIVEAGHKKLRTIDFPPGTELVELAVQDSAVLRGVFVPAGDNAPIVVHFPAMFESITWGAAVDASLVLDEEGWLQAEARLGPAVVSSRIMPLRLEAEELGDLSDLGLAHGMLLQFRRAGCAVLALDYAGVGASTGERSPENLARDAHAIYAEALRRADGDPQRVILRGVSLGTLAVARLLADGVQPAAISLAAPVRGETVVKHFARMAFNGFVATLADWFYADVGSADLQAEVARTRAPLFLAVPEDDALISADEREALRDATAAHGGETLVFGRFHEQLAIRARQVLPREAEFLRERVPALSHARSRRRDELLQRLRSDPLVVAKIAQLDGEQTALLERLADDMHWPDARLLLALAQLDPSGALAESLLPWIEWQPTEALAALPWNPVAALVDLQDPQGALEPAKLATLAPMGPALRESLTRRSDLEALVDTFLVQGGPKISGSISMLNSGVRSHQVAADALGRASVLAGLFSSEPDLDVAPRRALRLVLRTAAIPDRLREVDGAQRHELWWDGAWHSVSSFLP
ncbi:MAG: hypothetical protein DHS20C15_26260 [Planctomycetota bacterium]|nr:MAG: hypothetical protein DHS20C15_26260 [Planctomycetota bacterium]